MRFRLSLNIILLAVIVFSSGCASIVKGRYQDVSFQSVPDSVTVVIDGRIIGKTPLTANLKKGSGQVITFEKDGYKTLTMSLETRTSGWFWGNIVFGGFAGSTTDAVTGAVHEYSPSQYMVTLQPANSNRVTAAVQAPREARVKEFVIVGYSNIRADINSGSGQYLASLLGMLTISVAEHGSAIAKLKELADKHPNVMDFAEQILIVFPDKV